MRRQLLPVFAAIFILSLSPAFLAHASTASAVSYLEAHTGSPWVVMALSALGETPDTAFLQSTSGVTAVEFEAPILALTAVNKNPRTYPSGDLVQQLESYYAGGQIGDPATLNDDVFGVLALVSAGVPAQDSVVAGTRTFIEAHQNQDGGWPFMTGGTSDTNTTAAAIMARIASGSALTDTDIVQALAYLRAAQNPDGGFPYDPKSQWGTDSDASSDAWVMLALSAAGIDQSSWAASGGTPKSSLLSYQTPGGYFEYQHASGEDAFSAVTTAYAVLALSGKTLPISVFSSPVQPSSSSNESYTAPRVYFFASAAVKTPDAELPGMVLGTSTELEAATTPSADAPAETPFLFTETLHVGMQQVDVAELQKKLITHRLLSISAPTEWFGPLTLESVKIFQTQNGIPPTGFVGAMTLRALNEWQ